jgi:hypothetical protein
MGYFPKWFIFVALFSFLTFSEDASAVQCCEPPPKLVNPDPQASGVLKKEHFINPGYGRNQFQFGVAKANYLRAVKYADSGYAQDAFIASFAYRSGHYKLGKSRYSGKGRDATKSMRYLHLASDLGWPEASFILYKCYGRYIPDQSEYGFQFGGHASEIKFDIGGVTSECFGWDADNARDPKPVLEKNDKYARFYLERTAQQGHKFSRTDFSLIDHPVKHKSERLDWGVNMIIAQYKTNALMYRANQVAKEKNEAELGFASENAVKLYQSVYEDCFDVIPQMFEKAIFDEFAVCSGDEAGKSYCPGKLSKYGRGYQYVRKLLEACMVLAPSEETFNYYFNKRLRYQHPYFDQNPSLPGNILHRAKARYQSYGNIKKVGFVDYLIQKSGTGQQYAGLWEEERVQRANKSTAERQAKERQEAEEARQSAVRQAEHDAEIAAFMAEGPDTSDRWTLGIDTSMEAIEAIKQRTMRDIERMRVSSGNSQPSNAAPSRGNNRPSNNRTIQPRQGVVGASQSTQATNSQSPSGNSSSYEAEKANCIAAGKKWQSTGGCDYSSTVVIQGWNQGNVATVQPSRSNSGSTSAASSNSGGYGDNGSTAVQPYGGYGSSGSDEQNSSGNAWAFCWQSKTGKSNYCDGPSENTEAVDFETLEWALEYSGCPLGKSLDGSWYDCQKPLNPAIHKDVRAARGASR